LATAAWLCVADGTAQIANGLFLVGNPNSLTWTQLRRIPPFREGAVYIAGAVALGAVAGAMQRRARGELSQEPWPSVALWTTFCALMGAVLVEALAMRGQESVTGLATMALFQLAVGLIMASKSIDDEAAKQQDADIRRVSAIRTGEVTAMLLCLLIAALNAISAVGSSRSAVDMHLAAVYAVCTLLIMLAHVTLRVPARRDD
jgi:hypothetical protein